MKTPDSDVRLVECRHAVAHLDDQCVKTKRRADNTETGCHRPMDHPGKCCFRWDDDRAGRDRRR